MTAPSNLPLPDWRHYLIGRAMRAGRLWARKRKNARDFEMAARFLRKPRAGSTPVADAPRILAVETRHLGDVLFATPALRSLRKAFPKSRIAILLKPGLESLLNGNPNVDEVLLYEDGKYTQMVEMIAGRNFDTAVLFDRDERPAQLVFQAGVPKRIGYDRPPARPFLTTAVPRTEQGKSEVIWSKKLAEAAGGVQVEDHTELFLGTLTAKVFLKWNIQPGRPILIHPGSESSVPYKRWPVDRYAEVAQHLLENGHTIILTGLSSEQPMADVFPKDARCISLFGQTSLEELIHLISKCRLLITNDTGPSHIAAALNIPCIAITGFADPKIYHPYPQPHRALYHPIPCSPCFGSSFDPFDCPFHSCLKMVTVEEVLENALQLIGGATNPA